MSPFWLEEGYLRDEAQEECDRANLAVAEFQSLAENDGSTCGEERNVVVESAAPRSCRTGTPLPAERSDV